jgi:hypothetical protein
MFVAFNTRSILHRCDLLNALGPLHLAQAPAVLALAGDDSEIKRAETRSRTVCKTMTRAATIRYPIVDFDGRAQSCCDVACAKHAHRSLTS